MSAGTTGTATDPRTVAETYLQSWQNKDFDTLRSLLHEGVTFRGPLGEADGVDACIAGLQGMAGSITEIRVLMMAVEGNDVLTWYDLYTEGAPPVPTVNWSHVEDGRIARIRATFDPRPLLGSG
jgi:limonene-1,2-epoxide hydrolase